MATKSDSARVVRMASLLGFSSSMVIDSKGVASGIVVLWKEQLDIRLEWKLEKVICIQVSGGDL